MDANQALLSVMMMPTLFVPHGAPTFALRPGAAGAALENLAHQLQRPRAIVVVSPHWETHEPTVGTATTLETIYDFSGFPAELYTLTYPAHGSADVALEVAHGLKSAGYPVRLDPQRGLDHGAWVPLRMMYPEADIPVVPLSIRANADAAYHYALGQALQPLTDKGILVMGTGSITHNLGDYMHCVRNGLPTPDYVGRFADWVDAQLQSDDLQALLDYRHRAADATRAHPSEEHFMPFFVALGAAGKQAIAHRFHQGVDDLVIAMDGYQFGRAVQ